jgi:hypothetical protein
LTVNQWSAVGNGGGEESQAPGLSTSDQLIEAGGDR